GRTRAVRGEIRPDGPETDRPRRPAGDLRPRAREGPALRVEDARPDARVPERGAPEKNLGFRLRATGFGPDSPARPRSRTRSCKGFRPKARSPKPITGPKHLSPTPGSACSANSSQLAPAGCPPASRA